MMQDPVSPIIIRIRAADDTDNGQILTVSASNSVQDAKATHSERHHTGPHASGACVAVGGVSGVQLVAAADQV